MLYYTYRSKFPKELRIYIRAVDIFDTYSICSLPRLLSSTSLSFPPLSIPGLYHPLWSITEWYGFLSVKTFVFMGSSWGDRNECEVGEDGFDMMSFRSSLSLVCRDQIGGRPEGMWVDQLRYYWSNPAKGWRRLGTEKVEGIRGHTGKTDKTYGRLVMEGEWKRECPGWFLGSEVAQQDGWWCHLLRIRRGTRGLCCLYTWCMRLDQVTLGFISELIAS